MSKNICNFCGESEFDHRLVEYVYRHKQQYMVFRNVPAEICLHCGMRYYNATVLLELEQRFFKIQKHESMPLHTVLVPVESYMPA